MADDNRTNHTLSAYHTAIRVYDEKPTDENYEEMLRLRAEHKELSHKVLLEKYADLKKRVAWTTNKAQEIIADKKSVPDKHLDRVKKLYDHMKEEVDEAKRVKDACREAYQDMVEVHREYKEVKQLVLRKKQELTSGGS